MAAIEWNSGFELGIDDFDRQHRRLVEILNRLRQAAGQGCPRGAIQGVVSDLATYAGILFSGEETLMDRLMFPDRDQHRRDHLVLAAELAELESALANGQSSVPLDRIEYIEAWLINHMTHAGPAFAAHALGRTCAAVVDGCP